MGCRAGEVSKEDLLDLLARFGVTEHKLARWVHVNLLPKPRRHGRGRAVGGSVSCYPSLAVAQAAVLALFLKAPGNRNLDEAGWDLWVFGFPVTGYARDLLLSELEAQQDAVKAIKQRPKMLKQALRADRRSPMIRQLLRPIRAERLPRVFQFLLDLQVGHLPSSYSEQDWELALDATKALMPHQLVDEDAIWSKDAIAETKRFARETSLARTIRSLEKIDDAWLETLKNEAQRLLELIVAKIGEPAGGLLTRTAFLTYFKRMHVDPKGRQAAPAYRAMMGWTQPPLSPLMQLVAEHHQGKTR